MPWWAERSILLFFFTVVFLVFYAVAYSTILGIRDNYYRYAQKSSLQWTGPEQRVRKPGLIRGFWLLIAAVASAWVVVQKVIF